MGVQFKVSGPYEIPFKKASKGNSKHIAPDNAKDLYPAIFVSFITNI